LLKIIPDSYPIKTRLLYLVGVISTETIQAVFPEGMADKPLPGLGIRLGLREVNAGAKSKNPPSLAQRRILQIRILTD
jgi:hypothetical protein